MLCIYLVLFPIFGTGMSKLAYDYHNIVRFCHEGRFDDAEIFNELTYKKNLQKIVSLWIQGKNPSYEMRRINETSINLRPECFSAQFQEYIQELRQLVPHKLWKEIIQAQGRNEFVKVFAIEDKAILSFEFHKGPDEKLFFKCNLTQTPVVSKLLHRTLGLPDIPDSTQNMVMEDMLVEHCCLCMQLKFTSSISGCTHRVCVSCFDDWKKACFRKDDDKFTCPLCRNETEIHEATLVSNSWRNES